MEPWAIDRGCPLVPLDSARSRRARRFAPAGAPADRGARYSCADWSIDSSVSQQIAHIGGEIHGWFRRLPPFVAIGLDPAGDADPTGTVSELSEPAAWQSGEPDGGGAPDQLDEEREHDREEGHGEHKSKGEEAGAYIRHGDVRDETRRGARLILAFDPARSAFGGTVENTT